MMGDLLNGYVACFMRIKRTKYLRLNESTANYF